MIPVFNIEKIAGYYVINDGLRVQFKQKPNWFHRIMTKLLLGWKWVDK
jgi:hypothetical protein